MMVSRTNVPVGPKLLFTRILKDGNRQGVFLFEVRGLDPKAPEMGAPFFSVSGRRFDPDLLHKEFIGRQTAATVGRGHLGTTHQNTRTISP